MKIHILQPAVPHYRLDLYSKLFESDAFDFEIFSGDKDHSGVKSVEKPSINVSYSFPEISFFFNKLIWQSNVLNKKVLDCDAIIVCGNPRILSNYLLLMYAKFKGIKIYWWGQGWSANTTMLSFSIRKLIMKFYDGIILYTENEMNLFKSFSTKTFLNNGLDIAKIDRAIQSVSNNTYPNITTIDNTCFRLLFIGRITKKSKFSYILHAISLLKGRVPIKLDVIGTADNMTEYFKLAEDLKVESQVEWHGEIFNEDEIASIYLNADFFVYPGDVGLSLIHAFCYSKPAIIHNQFKNHMPEIAAFKTNENGIVFERDSIDSLANTLEEAFTLKKQGKIGELGSNARKIVQERFNTNYMYNQLIAFLDKGVK
jgi:glycosyltransferase involved in cell wall biosynthesis